MQKSLVIPKLFSCFNLEIKKKLHFEFYHFKNNSLNVDLIKHTKNDLKYMKECKNNCYYYHILKD